MDRVARNLGGRIPLCSRHVRHDVVAMATAVAQQRRSALNIQQIRESGGQTREPILMKFGTPQHFKTSITVT